MATDTQPQGFGATREERRQALFEKLRPTNLKLRHQLGLLGLLGFVLLPTQLFPSELGTYTGLLYLVMFAMSWDVVSGYTGQLSFGHGFFFALGGYTSAVLNMQHGVTPLLSIPSGAVVAAIGGVLIGVPALRLRGPYLSLVTLITPVILLKMFILFNDSFIINVGGVSIPVAPEGLGGTSGLAGLPQALFQASETAVVNVQPYLGLFPEAYSGFQLAILSEYYFSLALFVVVLAILLAVTRSSAGSVFTAIREDEDAVAAAGLNPAKFKLFAFVLSGFVGGLAGAAFIHTSLATAQPSALLGGSGQTSSPISLSINVIIMAILGGTGTIVGGAVGALFFGATQAVIGSISAKIPVLGVTVAELFPLPLLLAAMLVLVFLPGGLVRGGIRAGRFALAYRRGEKDLSDLELRRRFEDTALGQIVARYRRELNDIAKEARGR